jgi:hypothetical protein
MSYVSTLRALLVLALITVPAGAAFAQAEDGPEAAPRGVAFAPLLDMAGAGGTDDAIGAAWVQASTARDVESTWTWAGGLYMHLADMSGRQVIGDIQVDFDVGFGDLFDKLDGAFSGHFEGRNGNLGFGVDYVWVKVGEEGIDIGPADGPGFIDIEGAGTMTTKAFEFFGTYRIGDQNIDAGALDILLGGRYKSLSYALDITGLPMPVGGVVDESWWDVLFGGRWMKQAGDRVLLIFRADLGSDAWNVQGGAGINVWRQLDIFIEYKHIKYNHSQGSGSSRFVYDASESGPLFGFGFHF